MASDPRSDLSTAIDKLPGTTKKEKEEIKDWLQHGSGGKIQIMITGRTGVGKSTLVNSLIGKPVAKVGNRLRVQTKNVRAYSVIAEGGLEVVVWDSPGLQDGSGNEEQYLAELKENCSAVDVVIFCIKVATARADLKEEQKDLSAIKKLTSTFGSEFWEHSIFALTFANALVPLLRPRVREKRNLTEEGKKQECQRLFEERIDDWKTRIQTALREAGVPSDVIAAIPVEPAGHHFKPHLPGRQYWLSVLWFVFIQRAKLNSKPSLVKLSLHRWKRAKDVSDVDFRKEGYEQPIVVEQGGIFKGGIVTGLGVALNGIAIGAGVGATVGAAGAGVGAAVGLVAGGAVGLAVGLLLHYWHNRSTHNNA